MKNQQATTIENMMFTNNVEQKKTKSKQNKNTIFTRVPFNEPDRERKIPHSITYMWNPKKSRNHRNRSRKMVAMGWGVEK